MNWKTNTVAAAVKVAPLAWTKYHFPALAAALLAVPVAGGAAESVAGDAEVLGHVTNLVGVGIHLGGGEGAFTEQMAAGGRLLVQALEADERKVKAARARLQARGLYGPVSVAHWTAGTLPYADNLANVLVVHQAGAVPESEMMRVLAPHGIAWLLQGDRWRKVVKPRPGDYDEWTHARHGADGNMVSHDLAVGPPAGLRWVAGPPQDAGGKKWYYDHVLVSAAGRNFYFFENALVARDAYNGTLLWQRPLKAYSFKETGAAVPFVLQPKVKLGTRPSKVRPVASASRLFLATEEKLLVLDTRTGETAFELGTVVQPRELLVEGDCLVVSDKDVIRGYDLAARQLLWETALDTERIVAGDGSLFCLASNVIASFDLATGKERWRIEDTNAVAATTCSYHQGVLAVEISSWRDDAGGCGILVYSGQDGQSLWHKEYKPDMTHYKEARAFFADDLLWLQMAPDKIVGFDPKTGSERKRWGSRGKHCACPVATERYFIAPECDFTDLKTGKRQQARMFKSACRLPFIPANGLLYSFPVQCECFPMLRGYMGLAADNVPLTANTARLQRGPAWERGDAKVGSADPDLDWPLYRRDVFRSGSAPLPLPASEWRGFWTNQVAQPCAAPLALDWKGNPFVRGLLTPPVAAGGKVVVAVPEAHRVTALDAARGNHLWDFTAGGRIDTPPSLHEGRCLFGARDGWVYCLDMADGELAWKFRAAPQETRIVAYGQWESLWPVPGSVYADQGVAYLAAGRHPLSDGGVYVYALKVRTGEVLWEKTIQTLGLKDWYSMMLPSKKKVGLDFEPVDLFVRDGEQVAMSRWRFQPNNGKFKLELASTNYQAGALAVSRGLWGYGIRQTKNVQERAPAVFAQTNLYLGNATNTAALLLAGETLVTAMMDGALQAGERQLTLESPPVPDGLIAAYRRLYLSARNGQVICLGGAGQ